MILLFIYTRFVTHGWFESHLPHLHELTGSFAELIKNYKYSALQVYMCTLVRILIWLYLAEFS